MKNINYYFESMAKKRTTRSKMRALMKRRTTLETIFDCPICYTEKAVRSRKTVKDKSITLYCTNCQKTYTKHHINEIVKPIDVYYEWFDDSQKNKAE